MNTHKIYIASGIGFSILLVVLSFVIANRPARITGRAQTTKESLPVYKISRENSYIFASPLKATANGISIIRVTVVLINTQGLGVFDQKVDLKINAPVTIGQTSPITDTFGRAIFDLTSTTPGDYTISAESAGALLSQTAVVSFH